MPPTTICPGSYEKEGCYFIVLSRGFGEGEFNFWIETEVCHCVRMDSIPFVRHSFICMYM